mmetsp:Transcript_3347/g.4993  ORF Transcript_3347/g.4993 Transcript_3347/m.4993 type:complete len:288 (+) Transcript_3347:115-978(+)
MNLTNDTDRDFHSPSDGEEDSLQVISLLSLWPGVESTSSVTSSTISCKQSKKSRSKQNDELLSKLNLGNQRYFQTLELQKDLIQKLQQDANTRRSQQEDNLTKSKKEMIQDQKNTEQDDGLKRQRRWSCGAMETTRRRDSGLGKDGVIYGKHERLVPRSCFRGKSLTKTVEEQLNSEPLPKIITISRDHLERTHSDRSINAVVGDIHYIPNKDERQKDVKYPRKPEYHINDERSFLFAKQGSHQTRDTLATIVPDSLFAMKPLDVGEPMLSSHESARPHHSCCQHSI